MPAASTSQSTKQQISEILNKQAAPTVQGAKKDQAAEKALEAANDQKFANIAANPFHAIFANTELTPSQQQAEVAKLATATEDKAVNRANKAAYEEFMSWMQEKRQTWALKMISLVDTEVFSQLKKFYTNMNNGVIEFNESLKDLTDILEGLDDLRLEGKTLDAFAEIKTDKEEEARRAKIKAELDAKAHKIEADLKETNLSIKLAQEDKKWYIIGNGGLNKETRQKIAKEAITLKELDEAKQALLAEKAKTDAEFAVKPQSALDEKLAGAKEKLRQLLTLSDEEHNGRQERLVSAARGFVVNTKADTSSALTHLSGLGDQYQKLQDNAKNMRATVLIVNEGMKDAGKASRDKFDALNPPAGADQEGEIARMEREDKQAAIRDHITAIELTAGGRVSMLTDLTSLNSQANAMRETNEQEMQNVSTMNQNGVSGMAERLVTVLNGVDSAALHQGAEMTQGSLDTMNKSTKQLFQKGIMAHAVGMLEDNNRLSKAIEDIQALADQTRKTTAVTAEALSQGIKIRADNEAMVAQLKLEQENYLKQAALARDGAAEQVAANTATVATAANKKAAPRLSFE